MIVRCVPPTLLALTALFTSCRKPAVESYRVPKDTAAQTPAASPEAAPRGSGTTTPIPADSSPGSSAAPAGSAMANTPVATAGGAGLTWTAPSHWKAKPASQMRRGSFTVTSEGIPGETELSITAFPGNVGGDLANFNRWREQVQLPPVSPAEFESVRQRLERNGLQMTVVDIVGSGADAKRILGAMIPYGGATWFVKMGPGPDALVAKEKPAFMAFLDTIKSAGSGAK